MGSWRQQWQDFKASEPGQRFQDQHERRKQAGSGAVRRVLMMALGIVVTIAGLFFMPAPGPGTLILFAGLVLLARESLVVARLLDRAEVAGRKLWARFRR